MKKDNRVLTDKNEILKEKQITALIKHLFISAGKKPLAYCKVYGCQQNEADMDILRGILCEMGYSFTDNTENADLIIINTCAVREGAEFRIFGNLGALKPLKQKNKDLNVIVCGCMMQQEHVVEKIKNSYPHVDIVFGTGSLYKLPSMLLYKLKSGKKYINLGDEWKNKLTEGLPSLRLSGFSAFVTVMHGCNNFCSYCVVPYTRGRERSRDFENIIEEIKDLTKKGFKEISLLGQNVNSYGKDLENNAPDFADLLKAVNEIEGIKRIRFTTSHPKDLSDKLIDAIAACKKVCRHVHLPFQSGSNKILELMNRRYTREYYLSLVEKLKSKVPGVSLSTDVIVGFPGETNEDFEETLDLIKKVRFESIFSFIYSRRKGTPAALMPDVLTPGEISKNFEKLLEVQGKIGEEICIEYVGKTLEVLVEEVSKTAENMLTGRTESNKVVHFSGNAALIGKYIDVLITGQEKWYLLGERK